MRTFFLKIGLFLALNLVLGAALLIYFSGRHSDLRLPVEQTEANIFSIEPDKHYDVVLLGTSRGRVFSRDGNQQVAEEILGQSVANLSKGGGGGLMPAELHLHHFFARGGSANHIVYLVDPWVFFAAINNEDNEFFLRDEPFEVDIFLHLIKERYPLRRLSSYLQMIPNHDWRQISRYAEPGLASHTLREIDTEKQEKARVYYQKTYEKGDFDLYVSYLDKIYQLAREHGCTLSFIMLPILMDDFPGADTVDTTLCDFVQGKKNVSYYNLIGAMQDRRFFYDHMHFNRVGIRAFVTGVLKPVVTGGTVVPPVYSESWVKE